MDARKNIILDVPAARTQLGSTGSRTQSGSTGSRTGVTESPESLRIMPRVRPLAAEPPRFENRCYPLRRSGFTLVEMLTVIVIISILAGLITPAVISAIRRAREATISTDIEQLGMAMEQYKQERGDYPPDFAGVNGGITGNTPFAVNAKKLVLQHFRKAFPRYTPGSSDGCPVANKGTYDGLLYDINYATRAVNTTGVVQGYDTGLDVNNLALNPAAAIVLTLGGPPAQRDSSKKLLGFSANPANPFARGGSRLPSLIEFDEKRLQIGYNDSTNTNRPTSWPVYIPPHVQQVGASKAPYVYFRPRNRFYGMLYSSAGGTNTFELPYFWQDNEQGYCVPYADVASWDASNGNINRWMEPAKFQIICSGLDGMYGNPLTAALAVGNVQYKSGAGNYDCIRFLGGDDANIVSKEDDNITNFTQGKLADRAED